MSKRSERNRKRGEKNKELAQKLKESYEIIKREGMDTVKDLRIPPVIGSMRGVCQGGLPGLGKKH